MNQKILLAACLLAMAGTSGASDAPRQNFECDTPAGHFSYWNRTLSDATIDVAGELAVNELRKDGKWSPTALVILQGPEGKVRFGIRLYNVAKVSEMYFIEFVKPSGNEKLGLGMVPGTKDPIPFALHLDSAGQLRVSLAGFDASTSVGDFRPSSIEFSCSTGDFEFRNFTIQESAAD